MKVIQQLKTKLNTGCSIDSAGIIKKIEEYDVVSFDIFDTLLKRNVKKPTDVFKYMEKKYNREGFFNERIEAEKRARANNKIEVTLKDIYEEMPFDFSKEELETESELLIQNDWIISVYKKAVQSKIVIITSDMYLPEEFIIQILKREKIENKLVGDFAIVDIGWSGGMQRYLVETLSKLGIKSHIKGYYIGVADYYKRNIAVIPSLDLNGWLISRYVWNLRQSSDIVKCQLTRKLW